MEKTILRCLAATVVLQLSFVPLYSMEDNGGTRRIGQGQGPQAYEMASAQGGVRIGRPGRPGRSENVAAAIERNPGLLSRLRELLPSGTSLSDAAAGFKIRGQFIAALHAAMNLNIPFDQMRTR